MKMITPEECLVCRKHRGQVTVAGGTIYEDTLIFVSHAQLWGDETKHYLGHLFIEPKRHVAELADLTEQEGQLIGLFVTRTAQALMNTEKVEHVYSFVIGDGMPHVHVHVIGRYPGAPREYWGPRVDEWPGAPQGDEGGIEQVSQRIRQYFEAHY